MTRIFLAALLIALVGPAFAQTTADQYGRVVTCVPGDAGTVQCSTSDGISVQAPTVPTALGTINAMAPASYVPPAVIPTIIDPDGFMARLTPAEQTAIATAGQTNAQVMLFLIKLAGAASVDTTGTILIKGLQTMVTAGLLTAPRATQILDLTRVSP